ncbi:NusB antitermination factor [Scopulibacillus darangshiensis]|uniref:Transcription antitermination protein NusB n=1 Tax=Scopulibacillus darangshiensis TaxID=442528 RepID=A0A4R2PA99_9BACL|nr:transcription antitermination factor NusB [Scopulibacillus darangshiensis]TCP31184.1 NusB antitermination factor [Scopulibacillus darangshiensis]
MNRRQAREKAVQALFQISVGQADPVEAMTNVTESDNIDPFLHKLVTETVEHMDTIDEEIKRHLINWQFDRIGNIDKTILRLAVCEIRHFEDVPNNVAMNEAIELAKTFGDDRTRKFVNGILAKVK